MSTHATLLGPLLGLTVEACGHTDLALDGLKFSGNAQRRRKTFLLFHGCFLLQMEISRITGALPTPSKQPQYRLNRSHTDFLTNAPIAEGALKIALARQWNAQEPLGSLPTEAISRLVQEKYSRSDWNLKF